MHTEKRAYEDIARRKPSASQGERLPQKTTLPKFGKPADTFVISCK